MTRSRLIGILGGCSAVGTRHMYRRINALSNDRLGGWHMAETLIAGMDFGVVTDSLAANGGKGDWDGLSAYMARHLDHLAPADIVIAASNTLHKVLPTLMEGRNQDFIHIYDPTAAEAKREGVDTLILLGTRSTMGGGYADSYYADTHGLAIAVPNADEQAEIDRIIFEELCRDEVLDTSREYYLKTIQRLADATGAGGVILGCTEIQMLIGADDLPEMAVFDTMELLCRAAVAAALEEAMNEASA